MKSAVTRSLQIVALLFALAIPAFAEESHRGLFEGDLANNGGKVVAFVQGNHAISLYIFDSSGHAASFAGGSIGKDGTFAMNTNRNASIP